MIYDVTWHDMTWHDMTWHDMTWHDMIWYDMIWYDIWWYDMIWYDIWYDMICYDMIWYDTYLFTAIGLLPVTVVILHVNKQNWLLLHLCSVNESIQRIGGMCFLHHLLWKWRQQEPFEKQIKVNQSHYMSEVPWGLQEVKVSTLRDNGPGWR